MDSVTFMIIYHAFSPLLEFLPFSIHELRYCLAALERLALGWVWQVPCFPVPQRGHLLTYLSLYLPSSSFLGLVYVIMSQA